MGRGLGTLTLDLAVKTGAFTSGLDKAGRELDAKSRAMQRKMEATGRAIDKALGLGIVAVAGATTYAIKEAIDQADQLNDISKKIGIPTDVLSGLQYAAKLSGVATEELQGGLVKMIKFQAEAAKGAKENVKVFEALGIAIKDSHGELRDADDVFGDFAEVFRELEDGPEKTALALKVFGKAGAELIPLLDEGRSGIRSMSDELDRLGGTVTPQTARNADAFNDNLDKLKTAVGGLALQIASDLLPDMIALTDAFVDNVTAGEGVSTTAHNIAEAIREIASAAVWTGDKIQKLAFYMGELNKANPTYILGRTLSGQNPLQNPFSDPGAGGAPSNQPSGFGKGIRGGGGKGFNFAPQRRGFTDLYGDLFSPSTKSEAKSHAKAVDEVAAAYERMKAQLTETNALFNDHSELAKVTYQIEHGDLQKLSADRQQELKLLAAKQDALAADKALREEGIRIEEEEARALADHEKAVKDLLDDLAFETQLTALSNEEKEKAIALRQVNADAASEEGRAILASLDGLQKAREYNVQLTDVMDEFRRSFEDNVVGVVEGTTSIKDAFKSLADDIIAQLVRIAAHQLTESIFGPYGGTGAGSSGGGWLSGIVGAFLGGGSAPSSSSVIPTWLKGYATGGDPPVGVPYIVGEHGPEIRVDRTPGTIIPNGAIGPSITQVFNNRYAAPNNPRTIQQQASSVGYEARRAIERSGR